MVISKEGHLIVASELNSCIIVINTDSGEVINRFGQLGIGRVEFIGPEGLSLTQDGHIIVADTLNHRLHVLTVEGAFVAVVGSKGSQPLQFNYPYGVAVHHNGRIFVTDRYNHPLPEISGHGPIFSVYSSVYAIVEVNGRRWELGIKHRRWDRTFVEYVLPSSYS